jgi:hypothetical protein
LTQPTTALGGKLTFAQLEQLWIQAGGDASKAATAAAIALAESSGNPTALNNNPATGDYSVGPWQINYFGSLLGPRTRSYGSPASLLASPLADARAAVSISHNGQDFSPWTTYTSGAYGLYLNQNASGAGTSKTTPLPAKGTPLGKLTSAQVKAILDAITNGTLSIAQANTSYPGIDLTPAKVQAGEGNFPTVAGTALNSVSGLISFLTSWRFAEVIGGVILLIIGLVLLGRQFGVSPPSALAGKVPG